MDDKELVGTEFALSLLRAATLSTISRVLPATTERHLWAIVKRATRATAFDIERSAELVPGTGPVVRLRWRLTEKPLLAVYELNPPPEDSVVVFRTDVTATSILATERCAITVLVPRNAPNGESVPVIGWNRLTQKVGGPAADGTECKARLILADLESGELFWQIQRPAVASFIVSTPIRVLPDRATALRLAGLRHLPAYEALADQMPYLWRFFRLVQDACHLPGNSFHTSRFRPKYDAPAGEEHILRAIVSATISGYVERDGTDLTKGSATKRTRGLQLLYRPTSETLPPHTSARLIVEPGGRVTKGGLSFARTTRYPPVELLLDLNQTQPLTGHHEGLVLEFSGFREAVGHEGQGIVDCVFLVISQQSTIWRLPLSFSVRVPSTSSGDANAEGISPTARDDRYLHQRHLQ